MTQNLDLADIQGNILQDFVSGYPIARFVFLQIPNPVAGRAFIYAYRTRVTTALRWNHTNAYVGPILATKPDVAINLALTFRGMLALQLPTRTLAQFPPEFIDGMRARARILGGDEEVEGQLKWDEAWNDNIHILIGLNALLDQNTGMAVPQLAMETTYLQDLCAGHGIKIVGDHGTADSLWQDAAAQLAETKATYKPVPTEHFGFIDGISNPVFEGQYGDDPHADAMMAIGQGKIVPIQNPKAAPEDRWGPLATGEFLLGHPDEAQEIPGSAAPTSLTRNGTFLVYRKLHENVGSFNSFIQAAAAYYAQVTGIPAADACQLLKAKIAGRWPDGVPVAVAPTIAAWKAFNAKYLGQDSDLPYTDFTYGDDPDGAKCPITSHMRRANPRDSFDRTSSALINRRRLLRRGIPYGTTTASDTDEHGIIFLGMCADLSRQFEFIQQQWISYGLDANAGNDTCPLAGNRAGDAKFVLAVDPASGDAPFIWSGIPKFVEMRGGEYFFLPSMTALRMIGMGTVDPT
jgi:Dyp-type peroxidase family